MLAKVHDHKTDDTPISGAAFKDIIADFFKHRRRIFKQHF